MKVEVLVFEGCPHAGEAMALVRGVVGRLAPGAFVDRVEVDTVEKAAALGFLGSPSVRVNGGTSSGEAPVRAPCAAGPIRVRGCRPNGCSKQRFSGC